MTAEGGWRIVLADDHVVVRAGLRALLAADPRCRVVGEAAGIGELLVSLRTVESYRAGLRSTLGVATRADMVEAAHRLGLLP